MARWSEADLARLSLKSVAGLNGRTSKYGNEPQMLDGHCFDSKLEMRRYQELKLLLLSGQILDLRVHHNWFLHVQGKRIGYYESDFDYLEDNRQVIEDCKGVATALYRWKAKHVYAEYGIEIREIKA